MRRKSQAATFIIHHRGEMWPRNATNIELVPHAHENGGQGIYILFDGSTPVYVGRGNMRHRIKDARASKRRGQSWDHFSSYGIPKGHHGQELEALLLRMLPPYLRILNKQRGTLGGAKKHSFGDSKPDPINRPHIFGALGLGRDMDMPIVTINTNGITDAQKATVKFQSAYQDMLAQLTAPGFIDVLCAHEAAHVIYFTIAGTKNFEPFPATIYYDPAIDDYAGHLAAVQILDVPPFVQGRFWERFDMLARAHAAGGVVARTLMPSSDGGDQNDKDRFKLMCDALSADPNFSIDFEDYWKRAQDSVADDLKNPEWLAQIRKYAAELRPQLGL